MSRSVDPLVLNRENRHRRFDERIFFACMYPCQKTDAATLSLLAHPEAAVCACTQSLLRTRTTSGPLPLTFLGPCIGTQYMLGKERGVLCVGVSNQRCVNHDPRTTRDNMLSLRIEPNLARICSERFRETPPSET